MWLSKPFIRKIIVHIHILHRYIHAHNILLLPIIIITRVLMSVYCVRDVKGMEFQWNRSRRAYPNYCVVRRWCVCLCYHKSLSSFGRRFFYYRTKRGKRKNWKTFLTENVNYIPKERSLGFLSRTDSDAFRYGDRGGAGRQGGPTSIW